MPHPPAHSPRILRSSPAHSPRKRPAVEGASPAPSPSKYKGPNGAPSPGYRGRGGSANDDGSYWRKYGEKAVEAQGVTKGYFRCTEPGCPARKVITKDVGTAAITTIDYRGDHNHEPLLN
ncbi:putative WRKY transcription factor 4 [Monoraphidium neglectum]|uniref:Putative WRKY transcription factor 4 n=1 Tax=Monoraphidium neglectum TaxID=145388 RepID=A0A0D2JAA2_9CHLO|nr:putative WRKY transcription factor 4 [Monoraphidium neglectum]KIY96667.1 putative WRKY transcription factor 4 [Monoraphidium neglectum]|eukprot:XP_013895687.1 putative WRKY transcription factor 4 [Monoraphidium neglectum]